MMIQLIERLRDAALSIPSLGDLINRFLDWLEELSGVMAPASMDGLIRNEVRTRLLLD